MTRGHCEAFASAHSPSPIEINPIEINGDLKPQKRTSNPQNCPFPSNTPMPTYLPPKRQLHQYTHFLTTIHQTSHWLQWDAPNSPQNCPFPFNDHHQNPIHRDLARPHSPSPTASGSIQLFCHNTNSRQTNNRPTDRCIDQQMVYSECSITSAAYTRSI